MQTNAAAEESPNELAGRLLCFLMSATGGIEDRGVETVSALVSKGFIYAGANDAQSRLAALLFSCFCYQIEMALFEDNSNLDFSLGKEKMV